MTLKARLAAVFQAPAGRPRGRRFGLAMLVMAVLCVICGPFFIDSIAVNGPQVRGGEISFGGWGPLDAPVPLKGEWRADWLAPGPTGSFLAKVPGTWEGKTVGGSTLTESGAAAYHLRIRGLPADRYMLFIPKIYAGERVLVNGRLVGAVGQFGLTPETSKYLGRAQEIIIDTDGSDLDLEIDLSTYHHRENGFPEAPVIGRIDAMNDWILLDWIRSLLLVASLLLLGCLSAVIFVFRPEDRTAFYLAMGCATLLPLAATLSHDNLIAIGLPGLKFETMISLQLLSTTAALSAALAYANQLFPKESPRLPYLAIQGLNGARFLVYVGMALSGQVILLSNWSAAAYPFRIIVLVYILGVVIAACVRRRDGAWLFLFGLGAMLSSVVYTDLTSNAGFPRPFNLNLLPIGMLLLLFSQLVLLAERWAVAIGTEAQANSDLRRLLDVNISITSEMQLETLLTKVVEVTSKVIRADRTSLFLHDPKRRELFSVVAEGLDTRQIRFPATDGLAGWVFTHGEAVNLADAYADPRFNRQIDAATGYRTQGVLTVPVTARDGRRLGVMQALNRLDGASFDTADLERMSAFAAQAAVAIDNATLFSDVAAERNYNESILRSMSAGVVTLDREVKQAKLNAAAARILQAPVTRLEGVDVRAWIANSNPDLLTEIDAVAKGGPSRTLLDADVRTARGHTISANLSIVPLIGEKGAAGLLILIEDISEGKRMQSAMRRFMSQKVVDQVMDHDQDELLFGTACRASVLFADIRNFTSLAETLQPRQTVDMLNEVFSELVEAVSAHDGVLDKFLGDAVMAVYGAPISTPRDPQNAVESAVAMLEMLEDLNKRRRRRGRDPLHLGLGIATGDVVAGTVGSLKRMDYTVIGDSVNLASRLQQLTKHYQVSIIICETTAAALDGSVPLRELDTLRVRGRQQPAKLFQVLTGDVADRSPALQPYQLGRDCLTARRWEEAVAAFEAALKADPNDRPSALMLERARDLATRPPPEDWDGVWGLTDAA
ncbi:adenylate/guanylate cyclase domain-containing protein [uncultured Phenylobacterium sp.]|uniref:adenylate/guanylate cyclase domain-containing protein n=1 Tax=uncultured Phenylobacterium sp. TaxID=349273 RepID=UPI0025EDC4FB|nr:adenylate/guanylate cyclase domain-containing protein [uncultured Phenylobacterium sp.]